MARPARNGPDQFGQASQGDVYQIDARTGIRRRKGVGNAQRQNNPSRSRRKLFGPLPGPRKKLNGLQRRQALRRRARTRRQAGPIIQFAIHLHQGENCSFLQLDRLRLTARNDDAEKGSRISRRDLDKRQELRKHTGGPFSRRILSNLILPRMLRAWSLPRTVRSSFEKGLLILRPFVRQ